MRTQPSAEIFDHIASTVATWSEREFARRRTAEAALVARTGYAPNVVTIALDRLFESCRREALEASIIGEIGALEALDGFIARPDRPSLYARGVDRVAIISSQTTIGVALPATLFALIAKTRVLVKDRADGLIGAFAESLFERDQRFAETLTVQQWEGASGHETLDKADVVVAYGGDAALCAIRNTLPGATRFVGFGPRVSAALLTPVTLQDAIRREAALRSIADDALLYDAEGCLSLHILFVQSALQDVAERADELGRLAEELATSLDKAIERLPFAERERGQRLTQAAQREAAIAHAALHHGTSCRVGRATVIVDAASPPPLLPATTLIVPIDESSEIAAYLDRYHLRLEALALESSVSPPSIRVARLTTFGELQRPTLRGEHGGRPRILDFVDLVTDDRPTLPTQPT